MLKAEDYRAVFETAPDGVVVVSHDGRIADVNPQMESIFGYAREELLGEPVEMLLPEVFREAHREHRRRYVRNPHSRPMGAGMELEGRRRDGSRFSVEISLSPWPSDDDGAIRVVCTVRDVTERKRMRDFSEGALRSVEEERQRISRELHDDTAQRLAALLLRVRILSRETNEARRERGFELLREEILEAAEGVKRIARGLRPPELEDVGLRSALLAHIRSLREGAEFEVEAEIADVDHLLDPDARLALYRVVQESLSNVIRHAGTDRARLSVRPDGGQVVAVVADEGRGFQASRLDESGRGLGLVGMQERAVMQGGRVIVDSTPGEGTRVRVELPYAAVEAQNV